MDFLLSRYRNLTALLLVILAQLVLLAWQVKSNSEVRLIRVWAVTAVTPVARVLEFIREHTIGVAENYFVLVNSRSENERLKDELGKLKIENQFLKSELQTADRVKAMAQFQSRTPSRTLASRIIGTGTGANSSVVFIDRGSASGVKRGMAVITPDGIVGKVLAAYPTASQVMLITDPTFAAGVISDKNRVHGTLKGTGQNKVIVDYVQNEEKVEPGETFYTSGDDRVFPKGMPAGKVTIVRQGSTFKDVIVLPSAFQQGLEEVLVVIEGANVELPDPAKVKPDPDLYLGPAPDSKPATGAAVEPAGSIANLSTDADRLRQRYKTMGEQQGVKYGEGGKIPNFNLDPNAPKPPAAPTPGAPSGSQAPNSQASGSQASAPPAGTPQAVAPGSRQPSQETGQPRTAPPSPQSNVPRSESPARPQQP